ncbi:MAG: hypothetical protein FOGNACKC_00342 [Anaerolineae bacterium]|nr:hypothetical protein [Anaerolineae bacterium]
MNPMIDFEVVKARQREIEEEFIGIRHGYVDEDGFPRLSQTSRAILGLGSILLGLLVIAQSFNY